MSRQDIILLRKFLELERTRLLLNCIGCRIIDRTKQQSNNTKIMKTRLSEEQVKELYNDADVRGKALLSSIFGVEAFIKRPLGVWCLNGKTGKLVARRDWNNLTMVADGVVVVTEDMAFVVAPHNTVVAQWSPKTGGDSKAQPLITDINSTDAQTATNRIEARYDGTRHNDPDGEREYDFTGSPAADFCREYSHGSRPRGSWDLPTVKQLQAIAKNIKEVNACFIAMGCPTMVMGCYWSSIAHANNEFCAWGVSMYGGGAYSSSKDYYGYVRAVSAFQI